MRLISLIKLVAISGILLVGAGIVLSSCGSSQQDNETVAYVKHVTNEKPLLCPNRTDAELDMRTPGTMVSERIKFTVKNPVDAETLRAANVKGAKVKIISDELRWTFCSYRDIITKVEILTDVPMPSQS